MLSFLRFRSTPWNPAWLLAFGLSGCTLHQVGPTYEPPSPEWPGEFHYAAEAASEDPEGGPQGWGVFQDSQLEELLSSVATGNRTLKAGLLRLQQARSLVGIAAADGRPMVDLNPSVSRSRSSDAVEILPGVTNGRVADLYSLPLGARWEIDLFGRIANGREAALADAQAAQADWQALTLSLEAEAASIYLALRTLEMEIDVVEQGIALREASVRLIQDRVELGAATALDQAQAENQLAQSQADLSALQFAHSQAETALAVLAGEAATDFRIEAGSLSVQVPEIPAGMPSELLLRRPDLRRAERSLAAANARIGVAEAAFYPSFSLTGEAGWQASESGDLISKAGRIWGIAPSLYLPLFQGGRNRANLELAQARYEEVVEQYQNTVLEAIAEVESALAGTRVVELSSESIALAAIAAWYSAARTAREVARTRFEVGTVDYLNVLESERTALESERAQVRLLGDRYQNAVQLYLAIGGPR